MKELAHPRCSACGKPLVETRKTKVLHEYKYWQKPWGSAFTMDEVIIPYACMACGRVEFLLKNREKVIEDFEDLLPAERERYLGPRTKRERLED